MRASSLLVSISVLLLPIVGATQQSEKPSSSSSTFFWIESQAAAERGAGDRAVVAQTVTTLSYGWQPSALVGVVLTAAHANDHGQAWGETTVACSVVPSKSFTASAGLGIEHFGDHALRCRVNLFYDYGSDFAYAQFPRA